MPVEGAPAAVICLAPATGTERHAAEEFAKYAQQVLGRAVRLMLPGDAHDEAAAVVSVGRTALAESFIVRRLLTLPGDLGEEGFVWPNATVQPTTRIASPLHGDRANEFMLKEFPSYSHSIVPGGLLVMSKTQRFTPFTSLMMRLASFSSRS